MADAITEPASATGSSEKFQYKIAMSFASDDLPYAEKLYNALRQALPETAIHYYPKENNLGENLEDYLADVYENRAQYCVIIFSPEYLEKVWTTHELKSAMARKLREYGSYILPGCYRGAKIPKDLGNLLRADLDIEKPEQFAERILRIVNAPKQLDRTERMKKIAEERIRLAAARRRRKILSITGAAALLSAVVWYVAIHIDSHTTVGIPSDHTEYLIAHLSNSGWPRSIPIAYRLMLDGVPIESDLQDGRRGRGIDLERTNCPDQHNAPARDGVDVCLWPTWGEMAPLCVDNELTDRTKILSSLSDHQLTLEIDIREAGPFASDEPQPIGSKAFNAKNLKDFIQRCIPESLPLDCEQNRVSLSRPKRLHRGCDASTAKPVPGGTAKLQ